MYAPEFDDQIHDALLELNNTMPATHKALIEEFDPMLPDEAELRSMTEPMLIRFASKVDVDLNMYTKRFRRRFDEETFEEHALNTIEEERGRDASGLTKNMRDRLVRDTSITGNWYDHRLIMDTRNQISGFITPEELLKFDMDFGLARSNLRAREYREILAKVEERMSKHVRCIQKHWREAISIPSREVCRKRLRREFGEMYQALAHTITQNFSGHKRKR